MQTLNDGTKGTSLSRKGKLKLWKEKYTLLSQASALNWPCEMDTSKFK